MYDNTCKLENKRKICVKYNSIRQISIPPVSRPDKEVTPILNQVNRVVVTGIGAFTPLGLDMPTTWENLIAGKSGIDYITLFDASNMEVKFAGEVKGFDPTNYINRKDARRMDRFAQLAVAAGYQAVKDANLTIDNANKDDIGVFIGSGIGGLTTLFEQAKVLVEKGPDRVSPFLAPMMIADIAAAQISIALGVRGPEYVHDLRLLQRLGRHRRRPRVYQVRRRRGDDCRRRRGHHQPAGHHRLQRSLKPFPPGTTRRRKPPVPSIKTGTALSSARARSSSSWKAWSMPWSGAPISWRKSSATGLPPTRSTSPSRWKTATARPKRCRWR